MPNLADVLMRVLESFFNKEPKEYPTERDIVERIQERFLEFKSVGTLSVSVNVRLRSLIDYKILISCETTLRYAPGLRWRETPADQLEEG